MSEATPNPPRDRPKAMTIDLTLAVAAKLRKLSAKTGLTQAHLRGELSRSSEVEKAMLATLKQIHEDWKEEFLADELFGAEDE